MTQVVIGDAPLTIDDVVAVARGGAAVSLGAAARERIERAHDVIAKVVAEEQVAYGVTTGFGQLATTHIPSAKVHELQENLVRSHAVGVGVPLSREVVRAAMTIRLNTMARGHSGVRVQVAEFVAAMLNADLVPWVPSRGSLGASGDLAPSAHLVLAMMGEGELLGVDGGREPAGPALQAAGLAPLALEAKEGLSLLNGTQFMAAIGCFAVVDGEALLDSADLIGAMSLEGLRASVGPFEERIQLLRPIPGQLHTAVAGAPRHGGQRDHAQPPQLRQGPGCLLAALHPAGARRLPRRAALAARGHHRRGRLGHRQPARVPGYRARSSRPATSTASRSPWRSISRR